MVTFTEEILNRKFYFLCSVSFVKVPLDHHNRDSKLVGKNIVCGSKIFFFKITWVSNKNLGKNMLYFKFLKKALQFVKSLWKGCLTFYSTKCNGQNPKYYEMFTPLFNETICHVYRACFSTCVTQIWSPQIAPMKIKHSLLCKLHNLLQKLVSCYRQKFCLRSVYLNFQKLEKIFDHVIFYFHLILSTSRFSGHYNPSLMVFFCKRSWSF